MLNLKSELLKKQKEVDNLTSHKTSVIRAASTTSNKKVPDWLKKNPGVNQRSHRDLTDVVENDKHAKVDAILQAKSKLYDKMTSGDFIPDSEDSQMFLVDFEQKSIDAWRERSSKTNHPSKPDINVKVSSLVKESIEGAQEQWVEYVDSLGRTRTCLKEDLPHFQKQDEKLNPSHSQERSLMSDDMRREEERAKWEKEALEDMQDELHYENLRFGEIRELGTGYYAFSGKEEKREEQMKRLEQYRRETEKHKKENKIKKNKQQAMLTARLEKVRQRRIKQLKEQGKEIPASLMEPVQLPAEPDEEDESKSAQPPPQDDVISIPSGPRKTREWDKGKEDWTPALPPVAPNSWVDPRNERLSEFAPPEFYYSGTKRSSEEAAEPYPSKQVKDDPIPTSTSDSDRIQRLIAEVRSAPTSEQSDKDACTISNAAEDELEEAIPYTPTDTPITMKVLSKPNKLLNTKSALI